MNFELSARSQPVTGEAAPCPVPRRPGHESAPRSPINPEDLDPAEDDPELALQQLFAAPNFRQLISRQDCEQGELVVACFKIAVAAGQQLVTLQVPLYPAMASVPTVHATVFDRNDVRVRVTHRQRFGVRVELTLASPGACSSFLRVELNMLSAG